MEIRDDLKDNVRFKEVIEQRRMRNPSKRAPGGNDKGKYLYKFIGKYVKPTDTVLEIGSFQGISTEIFAFSAKHVITIDPYGTGENVKQDGGIDVINWAEKEFHERMKYHSNIEHMKMSSNKAFSKIPDESIDVLYIDGDHRPEAVIDDITHYFSKVKPNGIIAGHDYYEDIKNVINLMLGEPEEIFCETSWMFWKEKVKLNVLKFNEFIEIKNKMSENE